MPDTPDYPNGIPSPFSSQPVQPPQPPQGEPPAPAPDAPASVPEESPAETPPGGLPDDEMDALAEALAEGDEEPTDQAPAQQQPQQPPQPRMVWWGGTTYMLSGKLDQDTADYKQYANRTTGFANLDAEQKLYPGLYVLGAISSLGKTTYIQQLVEQIAASNDEYVLYFALEQGVFELQTKSLSRRIHQRWTASAMQGPLYTASQIQSGAVTGTPEVKNAIADYVQELGDRINVIEGNFSVTVEDIIAAVSAFIQQTGHKPIVVIDYLQIVTPSQINGRQLDTKAAIDHTVHSIKHFQSQNKLTVFVISSLNRQNYLAPIDFESFKESGGIEYTADVIWGLQLWAIHDPVFDREGKIKEKRDKIREAKRAIPREIELVCLKNRYGISSYAVEFNYEPAFDVFYEPLMPFSDVHMNDQKS